MKLSNGLRCKFGVSSFPEDAFGKILSRWVIRLGLESGRHVPSEETLGAGEMPLIVFLGDDPIHRILDQSKSPHILTNKIIYHLGGVNRAHLERLKELKIKAYFGYDQAPVLLLD